LAKGPTQVALWLIVVLLAVIATLLLGRQPMQRSAEAQVAAAAQAHDASGVFVVPAQIARELWGCYLIDTRVGTVVLYAYNPNTRKLKLMAARSFLNDRYLKEHSTEPSQLEIEQMLEVMSRIKPPADTD
jgi:hypothetical protein